jgi:hypothetical protein
MEFLKTIQGEQFSFSAISKDSFLVTGTNNAYILYKINKWECADMIPSQLLKLMNGVLEDHLKQKAYSSN